MDSFYADFGAFHGLTRGAFARATLLDPVSAFRGTSGPVQTLATEGFTERSLILTDPSEVAPIRITWRPRICRHWLVRPDEAQTDVSHRAFPAAHHFSCRSDMVVMAKALAAAWSPVVRCWIPSTMRFMVSEAGHHHTHIQRNSLAMRADWQP